MRITVVSSGYPPAQGGVADYTAAWIAAMRKIGHNVSLITSTAKPSGIDVYSVFEGPWGPRSATALAHLIREQRPEVVVVQYVPHAYSKRGGGLMFALLMRATFKNIRVPLIINAHEIYGAWSESVRRLPWHAAQRIAAGILIKNSSAFVVTVRRRQVDLTRMYRAWHERIRLLPIGPTILPTEPDAGWRKNHGVNDATVVVATLGLGHPTQDTGIFAHVLDEAVAHGLDLRLFVGGKLAVEHSLATNLGYLDSTSASQLLSASDIFALPLTDGISGRRSSAISALASKAIVVSTDGPDTDSVLFRNSGIALTPAGDIEAFSQSIIELAQNPRARTELRSRSQRFFDENFAWETLALKWEDLLVALIDESDHANV